MSDIPPRVFMSYAHVNASHKNWVRLLAMRLRSHGVEVLLDQWENTAGSNVILFMNSGLTDADRVVAIVGDSYRDKATAGTSGVGYETQILSAEMMTNQRDDRVIPVLRDNAEVDFVAAVPPFLKGRLAIDMRDDASYDEKYDELLRTIHRRPTNIAPPIGPNPFDVVPDYMRLPASQQPLAYTRDALAGDVRFSYRDNDGWFVLGHGDRRFTTHWGEHGDHSVRVYSDGPDVHAVAVTDRGADVRDISDAASYQRNSSYREVPVGATALWLNKAGYWAATTVREATRYGRTSEDHEHTIASMCRVTCGNAVAAAGGRVTTRPGR